MDNKVMKGKSVFNWNMKDVNGFEPVVDGQSVVLVLGTAPGAQSLLTGEYYANRGNIFWEIISHIFNGGRPFASYAEKVACLHQNHIALWDTLSRCRREGSTDDNITAEEHNDIDRFLAEHRATVQVREGYGTTETVTACCLTPSHMHKEGSIGLPFPDTYIKIVEPGTDKELPYREEGEILLASPTVMKEYMHNPEETAETLRRHDDGLTWVYTGDLGTMDEQGFVYFKGRAKRMIVSSGYNIYPAQIENVLDAHELVQMSCVIGVPDDYKMQKVKAFVKLVPGAPADGHTKQLIMDHCRKSIAKYAMPYDIEFREDMPKTLVGKVAYRKLEEEELKRLASAKA